VFTAIETTMAESRFSSLPQRALVALVGIPLILWMTLHGGYAFFAFVALISGVSLFEFYRMTEAKGAHPLKAVGLTAGFLVNGAFIYERTQVEVYRFVESLGVRLSMFSQSQFLLVVLLIFLLSVLLVELFRTKGSALLNAGATVLGVAVISLFFGTLVFTRELYPFGFPVAKFFPPGTAGDGQIDLINRWGGWTVIGVFASIWMCDTAAYFGGLAFGRHRLFERVSPKKSWEGAVFGFVFSVIAMVAVKLAALEYLPMIHAIVLGALVGVFGQIGDLVESRLKRDAGVKDSSGLIPGHGGVYDRFDSLVYVAPIVYLYIDFVVLS
jgi:phosphatidate cytidylyltransferase